MALKNGDYSRFSDKEQAALRHAERLSRESYLVNSQDFVELKKHFGDAEIVDLHMLTGLVNLRQSGYRSVGPGAGVSG